MAKGKKGKKGKKKKEVVAKDELTEVDREIFQLTITDLTRKYERIKARCLELEALNEELQKSYEKLDEDRADIISYLNRTVQQKMDEIAELKERLEGLQAAKDAEQAKFKERIATLEHEYKVMHEQLTSEIKLLMGKLNSLEEFRIQRDDLLKKFRDQEAAMEEQEERHKRTLYEVERKFIVGKDKLKKEMEARLVQLSQDFQETTQLRVAATTHRTIRENIALNNELDLMLETAKHLQAQNYQIKHEDTQYRLKAQLHEQEKNMVLCKNRVQHKIIETLANDHEEMEEMVGGLQEKANRLETMDRKLKNSQADVAALRQHITSLQQRLDSSNYEQAMLRMSTVTAEQETLRLQKVLRQTVGSVKDALNVQRTPSQDEAFNVSRRESLLNNLLALLNMAHLPEETHAEKSVFEPEIYETGDLGLIAKASSTHTVGSGNYSYTDFATIESNQSDTESLAESTKSALLGSIKSKSSVTGSVSSRHSQTSMKPKTDSTLKLKTSLGSIKEVTDSARELLLESGLEPTEEKVLSPSQEEIQETITSSSQEQMYEKIPENEPKDEGD